MTATTATERVVIVGGGAGGVELAVRLGHAARRGEALEVVLVDPSPTHIWKPMLHEVAAGTLPTADHEVDYLQLARRHGFRFHPGALSSVDRRSRKVWLAPLVDADGGEIAPRRALPYDRLVLAIGSVVNDFGTPGVKDHAVMLDSPADARRIHRRLLAACARAELAPAGAAADPVDLVIVGGGAAGVELAAELVDAIDELAGYGERLPRLVRASRITLVEAAPRLLGALPEDIASDAQAQLERRGVAVRLGAQVVEVGAEGVTLADGSTIGADITVWAAGIQGPRVLGATDGLERNRRGQLVVRPTLQTTLDDRVLALGDCASCIPATGGRPVPPLAQAAQQQARLLARSLRGLGEGEPMREFTFRDRGSLVSLGRRDAVGRIEAVEGRGAGRGLRLGGVAARWAYWALQRRHMAVLHGFGRTLMVTLGSWLVRQPLPRVKLH